MTNLRGGVGKSSPAFNLAYEISRKSSILIVNLCAQCNLTEVLRRGEANKVTILDALRPKLLGPAFGIEPDELAYRGAQTCLSFMEGKAAFVIAGDAEMYAFPSQMYQQLQIAAVNVNRSGVNAVRALLLSLRDILEKQARLLRADVILMDTSPFYSGGTHLAWCAADAMIVPVRVDDHSTEIF